MATETKAKKDWPRDCVVIVAAERCQENRANMDRVVWCRCLECEKELAADSFSIETLMQAPVRRGRPVKFLCVPCATEVYDMEQITHFFDHRFRKGAPPRDPNSPRAA